MTTIYGLIDPRDQIVRYVGQTKQSPHKRLIGHLSVSKYMPQTLIGEWIRRLAVDGIKPEIIVLELVQDDQADEAEIRWIRSFDAIQLTNASITGNKSPRVLAEKREQERMLEESRAIGAIEREKRKQREENERQTDEIMRRAIIEFRTARGWSQARLAKELGYHYSNISLWESGKRSAPPVVMLALQRLSSLYPAKKR